MNENVDGGGSEGIQFRSPHCIFNFVNLVFELKGLCFIYLIVISSPMQLFEQSKMSFKAYGIFLAEISE
jgi:hypothetical protein